MKTLQMRFKYGDIPTKSIISQLLLTCITVCVFMKFNHSDKSLKTQISLFTSLHVVI